MLRRIILENFMSHGRTEIDLADGLTVLTGPNNCGKSAVVAALQILATNGRSRHVLRHGAKFCRVTVETDDSHTICWERSKTTVKYTIDGEDIHRVGNSVPDSLHDLLRLDRVETESGKTRNEYDIHFGEQKSPIFLLGETGSRAASFFASSSDASRLVEMQHLHRLKLREQRAEVKRLNSKSENNAARLKCLEPIEAISDRVATADSIQQTIAISEGRIKQLREMNRQLDERSIECENHDKFCKTLGQLDLANTNPDSLLRNQQSAAKLRSLATGLFECSLQLNRLYRVSDALQSLAPVPRLNEVSRLQVLIDQLTKGMFQRDSASAIVAGCKRLAPPPELHPATACQRVLGQIVEATKNRQTVEKTDQLLSPLRPVPKLDNTNRLESLLSDLVEIGRRQRSLLAMKRAFAPFAPAPRELLTLRIRQLMMELEIRKNAVRNLSAGVESLLTLEPPATEVDLNGLATAIDRLSSSLKAVQQAQENADSATQQVSECEMEIRQFVKANPKCETCGASLDPETLMTSVPTMHGHALTSDSDSAQTEKGRPS